jgi:anthranilate phosphoribosyltransferase
MDLRQAIGRLIAREDLGPDDMAAVVGAVMDGAATPAQVGALIVALRMKGETPSEIAGAARAMRARVTPVRCDAQPLVDTCGTGGDGRQTINVSTIAAVVVAAAGVHVAKHGNRSVSSRCGSADLLEELGVNVSAPLAAVERCLREVRIGFLFAPLLHPAMKHAAGPRREIGQRSIFNLLGPLTNPAGASCQVLGVYDPALCEPLARALGELGAQRVFVVHGGGLDEVAPAGPTNVAELHNGEVRRYLITPADFGLQEHDPAGLTGGAPKDNAAAARAILAGAPGAGRAAVIMAAALALSAAGAASSLRAAARAAGAAIDGGAAARTLEAWVETSRFPGEAGGAG